MQILNRLTLSAYGMHLADQVSLVSVPLVAALVFNAPVEIIGLLVAAQSLAHLLGSLPAGLIVDRMQLQKITTSATLISFAGFSGATISVATGSLFWFGVSVTIAGFGVVLFVLASLSILPKITEVVHLARANGRIEMPRAVASFIVPLTVGILITETIGEWIFGIAALGSFAAFLFALKLPQFPFVEQSRAGIVDRILEGGQFVLHHELLLPISVCSLFWNMAFSALLVIMIPLVVKVYLLDPGVFGVALSAFGLAATAGTWTAQRFSARIPPNLILLFGPFCSVLAASALLIIPAGGPSFAVYASFFVLGFGPSMWLITQNSIRQLVVPGEKLGRVNAVIQTAIYGVRPAGALLGGTVVGLTTPGTGLLLVIAFFLCSLLATVFSRLLFVRSYTDLYAIEKDK